MLLHISKTSENFSSKPVNLSLNMSLCPCLSMSTSKQQLLEYYRFSYPLEFIEGACDLLAFLQIRHYYTSIYTSIRSQLEHFKPFSDFLITHSADPAYNFSAI
jgi:hypothetical protein